LLIEVDLVVKTRGRFLRRQRSENCAKTSSLQNFKLLTQLLPAIKPPSEKRRMISLSFDLKTESVIDTEGWPWTHPVNSLSETTFILNLDSHESLERYRERWNMPKIIPNTKDGCSCKEQPSRISALNPNNKGKMLILLIS